MRRRKKISAGESILVLILLVLSCHLYQALGTVPFLVFIALILSGGICWVNLQNSKKRRAFEQIVLETIKQRRPPEVARSINLYLSRRDFHKAELIRKLQIIRDSIDIALSSRKRDTAESRMTLLLALWREIEAKYSYLMSKEILKIAKEIVSEAQKQFQTALYINLARGYIEKADSLKTDKAKEKYRFLAREIILEGLSNPQSDKKELEALLQMGKAEKAITNGLER